MWWRCWLFQPESLLNWLSCAHLIQGRCESDLCLCRTANCCPRPSYHSLRAESRCSCGEGQLSSMLVSVNVQLAPRPTWPLPPLSHPGLLSLWTCYKALWKPLVTCQSSHSYLPSLPKLHYFSALIENLYLGSTCVQIFPGSPEVSWGQVLFIHCPEPWGEGFSESLRGYKRLLGQNP